VREYLALCELAVFGRRQHRAVSPHQQRAERTIPVRTRPPGYREHFAHVSFVHRTKY
jgi:hypothetical protein